MSVCIMNNLQSTSRLRFVLSYVILVLNSRLFSLQREGLQYCIVSKNLCHKEMNVNQEGLHYLKTMSGHLAVYK
jgi:hypothetical protein